MSAFINPLHTAACAVLQSDPVMDQLIAAVGPYALRPSVLRSPFEALVRAVAHQQLNGVAAERILQRLRTLFGAEELPSPSLLLTIDERELRAVGFSYSKIAALKDLAANAVAGIVPPLAELQTLADLEIIERLSAVRGIGRWTVEMLLIFQLERPDVLPVDDFGVRNGFRLAYGLRGLPLPRALAEYGERWKPYRSAAAWYLWRAVELARNGTLPRCRRPPRIAIRAVAEKVARPAKPKPGRARRQRRDGKQSRARRVARRSSRT
jgi:DNA-3-methyladenine glycosylase II